METAREEGTLRTVEDLVVDRPPAPASAQNIA